MGFVVAHEAGHLLLGRGARSTTGLMKCYWDRHKMQQLDALNLGFSELQAFRIRNTLKDGGLRADSTCVTTSHADRSEPKENIREGDAMAR